MDLNEMVRANMETPRAIAAGLKRWCPRCKGTGHDMEDECKCESVEAWITGCCEMCYGEGMLDAKRM